MSIGFLPLLFCGIGIMALFLAIVYRDDNCMPFIAVSLASFCIGTGIFFVSYGVKDTVNHLLTIQIDDDSVSDELEE